MKKTLSDNRAWIVLRQRKTVLYVALGLSVAAGSLMTSFSPSSDAATHHDSNTQLVVARLNALQTQLNSVQESIKKPIPDVDLSAITEQINAVSVRIDALRDTRTDMVTQTLTQTESALSSKLDAITDAVGHLNKQDKTPVFVGLEVLPFKVVSIDSIQHVPVASIAYDFKTVPLEKGDDLAGWRVASVDYGKQSIELVNKQNEHVRVTHEHLG